jgi:flagellar secretion chaperone FliS
MQSTSANEQYLQTMVLTASPAKLRYLLLDRAGVLVETIKENRMRNSSLLVDEKTLTLRDILGELLSGVKRSDDSLSNSVADLYVFLIQELTYAEREPGTDRIDTIGHIIEIEKETWKQVCEQQSKRSVPAPTMVSGGIFGDTSKQAMPAKSLNFNA